MKLIFTAALMFVAATACSTDKTLPTQSLTSVNSANSVSTCNDIDSCLSTYEALKETRALIAEQGESTTSYDTEIDQTLDQLEEFGRESTTLFALVDGDELVQKPQILKRKQMETGEATPAEPELIKQEITKRRQYAEVSEAVTDVFEAESYSPALEIERLLKSGLVPKKAKDQKPGYGRPAFPALRKAEVTENGDIVRNPTRQDHKATTYIALPKQEEGDGGPALWALDAHGVIRTAREIKRLGHGSLLDFPQEEMLAGGELSYSPRGTPHVNFFSGRLGLRHPTPEQVEAIRDSFAAAGHKVVVAPFERAFPRQ